MTISPRELHRVVPAVIIYNQEKKYLILKRSEKLLVFPGRWGVVGGGFSMDDYEHLPHSASNDKEWYYALENALRREVKEEVDIEIGKPEYLLDLTFIRPDGIPVLVLSYYAPYLSGEVRLEDGEHTEFIWVTAEEAKNYDLIGDILMEIEMVDKRLKK